MHFVFLYRVTNITSSSKDNDANPLAPTRWIPVVMYVVFLNENPGYRAHRCNAIVTVPYLEVFDGHPIGAYCDTVSNGGTSRHSTSAAIDYRLGACLQSQPIFAARNIYITVGAIGDLDSVPRAGMIHCKLYIAEWITCRPCSRTSISSIYENGSGRGMASQQCCNCNQCKHQDCRRNPWNDCPRICKP